MWDYYKYLTSFSQNLHAFDSGKENLISSKRHLLRENLEREDYISENSSSKQSVLYLHDDWARIEQELSSYIDNLHSTLLELITFEIDANCEILVVGMGNQFMTADSLGIEVAKKLIPTRHIKLKKEVDFPSLSVLIPNVLGVTGIETADAVNSICNLIKPHLVIALDSLCATSLDRFAKTIQLTNTGITPGAGVENARKKLSKENLGCDVVAIGVPLLIQNINSCENEEQKKPNMYFTAADIDEKVRIFSKIISGAINKFVLKS